MQRVSKQDLAVNGGVPVRSRPWPPWPHFEEEEKQAVRAVLDSDDVNYHRGEWGIRFETAFARWCGVRYGLAVTNGGAALHCAAAACGLGPGDEVIVSPHTYIASDLAPVWMNATPVFADIDAATLNICADTIAPCITERTRAIVAVHMYGRPCDMDEIMALAARHGLLVIEDCAQAHGATYKGARVGSLGHIAAFSFCQTKHLTTGGEGGMVVTDDLELARRARAAAHYGTLYDRPDEAGRWSGLAGPSCVGWNMRMTEMQSAIGLTVLGRLDAMVAKRRDLAAYLTAGLAPCAALDPIPEGPDRTHSYFRYDCLFNADAVTCTRDEFVRAVGAEGVPIGRGSSFAIHLDPRWGGEGALWGFPIQAARAWYRAGSCPVSEAMGERVVCLEVWPTIERSDCDDVLAAIRKVEAAYRR
ncbi:MAG: DegT/DnrJ/EryC1/StrS family aminotransferase [Armatimonadota bacterium]